MIDALELSWTDAEKILGALLRCPINSSGLAGATIGEHVRTALFGSVYAGDEEPIHTTRLLSNARRALDLSWARAGGPAANSDANAVKDDYCREILKRMSQSGDAWHAGHGRWLATPLRLVGADNFERKLVIGSTPLAIAESALGSRLTCAGPSRFVEPAGDNNEDLYLSIDDWLGFEPALEQWTRDLLASAEMRMEHVGGLAIDQFEIYAPDVLSEQGRRGRWIAATEVERGLPSARLCRPKLANARAYDRPYYLAHFRHSDGRLSLQRQASIEPRASLRLRFGLDARLKAERQFEITLEEELFTVEKPLSLPEPEQRVLSLGWPELNAEPQKGRLTFHNDALPFVLHALQRLSVSPVFKRRTTP